MFSQLLHQFPRPECAQLVAKHQAERGSKGFTCWTQGAQTKELNKIT